jgi:hypothetical protein
MTEPLRRPFQLDGVRPLLTAFFPKDVKSIIDFCDELLYHVVLHVTAQEFAERFVHLGYEAFCDFLGYSFCILNLLNRTTKQTTPPLS